MEFLYKQLNLQGGDVVRVDLDTQANVMLLDSINFINYKNGRQFKYFGGLAKSTPARITTPRTGTWYVVIDLGGRGGHIKYSISVE